MKNFTRFASNFQKFKLGKSIGIAESTSSPIFEEVIDQSIKKCHIFEIKDSVKKLLALTKCPTKNDVLKLPFPIIFLDVDFDEEEMEKLGITLGYKQITGIIVARGKLVSGKNKEELEILQKHGVSPEEIDEYYNSMKPVGDALRITMCSEPEKGRIWFDTFNADVNIYNKTFTVKVQTNKDTNPNARKFVHLFILNFLNFLYNPETEWRTVTYSKEKNKKRIEKGKTPIPPRNIIKITGELKKYVDKLDKDKKTWTYNYRFWVRGHWRTLKDKEYWGEKAGTRIFIPPYIKGKGVLFGKKYSVEKTDHVKTVGER